MLLKRFIVFIQLRCLQFPARRIANRVAPTHSGIRDRYALPQFRRREGKPPLRKTSGNITANERSLPNNWVNPPSFHMQLQLRVVLMYAMLGINSFWAIIFMLNVRQIDYIIFVFSFFLSNLGISDSRFSSICSILACFFYTLQRKCNCRGRSSCARLPFNVHKVDNNAFFH